MGKNSGKIYDLVTPTVVTSIDDIQTETDKIPAEIVKTTAIKAVTDVLPDGGAFTTEFVKTAAIKVETDKITGFHGVPAKNSTDNVSMSDVIGNKTDDEDGDSIYANLYIAGKHIHTRSKSYPFLAAGITLTGHNTALTLGTKMEIVPVAANEVNTITITAAATAPGTVTINLDGKNYAKEVAIGTTGEVAAELRAYTYGDWSVGGSGNDVVFTRSGIAITATFTDTDTTGVTASIVKTNTGAGIGKPFDIHYVQSGVANVSDTYIVVLYSGATGAEEIISTFRTTRVAAQSGAQSLPIITELLPAGTRISAACASVSGGEDTIVVSINYHEY